MRANIDVNASVGGRYSPPRDLADRKQITLHSASVEDRFSGYHLLGGAEYRIRRWIALGGDVTWATVPDAIGEGGVSAQFDETNLGGTSIRFKITIGR